MPPAATPKAIAASRYSIVIDGVEVAAFSELVTITSEVEPVGYQQSTAAGAAATTLLGEPKPAFVELRRGMSDGMELWAWHEAVVAGNIAAAGKDCSLDLYASDGKPVARFHLEQAWPSSLEVTVSTGKTPALLETVTLVCARIQRVSV